MESERDLLKNELKQEIMNEIERLIGKAVVAIIAFIVVNNYVNGFLIANKWAPEVAAIPSLLFALVVAGIPFGIVQILLQGILKKG